MIYCIFSSDVVEGPCVCIGTPTIVGREDTPHVRSLPPIGLAVNSSNYRTKLNYANRKKYLILINYLLLVYFQQ